MWRGECRIQWFISALCGRWTRALIWKVSCSGSAYTDSRGVSELLCGGNKWNVEEERGHTSVVSFELVSFGIMCLKEIIRINLRIDPMGLCPRFLWLPQQITTNRWLKTTTCSPPVLEARVWNKCQQGTTPAGDSGRSLPCLPCLLGFLGFGHTASISASMVTWTSPCVFISSVLCKDTCHWI